jgi:hypothetical protein
MSQKNKKKQKEQKNKRNKRNKRNEKKEEWPERKKKRKNKKKGRGARKKKEKKKRDAKEKRKKKRGEAEPEKKKGDSKEEKEKKKRNETGAHCWIRSTCCRYVPRADVLRRNAHRAAGNAVHRRGRLRVRRAIPHRVRDLRCERVVRADVLLERTLGFRMLAL